MKTGSYQLGPKGSDLLLRVRGPDLPACLSAAVEGFAAFVAEPAPGADRRSVPLVVEATEPNALLVALLDDAILRLDADGELSIALRDPVVADGALRATVEVVDIAAVRQRGAAPKAATWHEVRLERAGDGWEGQIMLDL